MLAHRGFRLTAVGVHPRARDIQGSLVRNRIHKRSVHLPSEIPRRVESRYKPRQFRDYWNVATPRRFFSQSQTLRSLALQQGNRHASLPFPEQRAQTECQCMGNLLAQTLSCAYRLAPAARLRSQCKRKRSAQPIRKHKLTSQIPTVAAQTQLPFRILSRRVLLN
jgi:hypothetical protein